tara:strand:- start:603 stop:953 length:351 start_codon:yes stop_codon:yes gene_type:complete
MTNIVQFPKAKRNIPPQSMKEVHAELSKNKKDFVDGIVGHYSSQLANKIAMHGFKVDDEDFLRDFAFTVEALRSGLYRSLGVSHPFQDLMDETIEKMDIEEDELDDDIDEDDPTRL